MKQFWIAVVATCVWVSAAGTSRLLAQSPEVNPPRPSMVAIYLDTSGSMQGSRAAAMKEGAKLAVATLDSNQEVVIVSFCDKATAARFFLRTPTDRQAAMQHVDNLLIGGGTNYLCALQASKLPAGTPGIFLSDGEHNGDPAPVLAYLKAQSAGPLYTVGIEAPPQASKLLAEMAALTGGNHVGVNQSEAVVKVFLELARNLGKYRSYTPQEDKVECKNVTGKLIVIGFDAVPEITTDIGPTVATLDHVAKLPGEHVNLRAVELAKPTSLVITSAQKRGANGRLAAILRQDLLQAQMKFHAPDGKAGTGTNLKVTTRFLDSNGKIIDPRTQTDLSSAYVLIDASGKILKQVLAKPSSTQPAFEAVLPLPSEPGTVTIRNITTDARHGVPFEDKQEQIVVLQNALRMVVTPASVLEKIAEGRFTVRLHAKVEHDTQTATFSATLEGSGTGLRLLEARSKDGQLELDLEGLPGSYHGNIVVEGTASVPLETVRIPFDIHVRSTSLGLALSPTRTLKIGPILANSGSKMVASLDILSLDADELTYTVDVEDLSNGAAVIPCQADAIKITPSKNRPGKITLVAEIGNVPAGSYSGSVLLKAAHDERKAWRTSVALEISEPLSIAPIDVGKVEIGKTSKRNIVVRNAGGAIRDLRLIHGKFDGKSGDIVLTLADKFDLAARQHKDVPLAITVSDLIKSRGVHTGSVIVKRGAQEITVPVQLEIVSVGEGPCGFLAAPAKVHLRGKPGEVLQFEIRNKLTVDAGVVNEELTATAGAFKDGAGKAVDLQVEFRWAPGAKLSRNVLVTAQGFIVAPDRRGSYSTMLTIRSTNSGTILIPFTLEVE